MQTAWERLGVKNEEQECQNRHTVRKSHCRPEELRDAPKHRPCSLWKINPVKPLPLLFM